MDSCHSNFLSNLRLKWGTKNGAKESSDPDKIRIEHSIPRTFLSRGEKTYYILVDIIGDTVSTKIDVFKMRYSFDEEKILVQK